MAYNVPPQEGGQVPAIIVYGDAIDRMDEARRQEIAASLEVLLGASAIVTDVDVKCLESPAIEEAPIDPIDAISPFTLLIDGDWRRETGRNKYIEVAQKRAPGIIADETRTKHALFAVMRRAYAGGDEPELFTYHFAEGNGLEKKLLRGVTFQDPQVIIDDPKRVQECVKQLGPKGAGALAKFIVAFTQAREY